MSKLGINTSLVVRADQGLSDDALPGRASRVRKAKSGSTERLRFVEDNELTGSRSAQADDAILAEEEEASQSFDNDGLY